jgi:acetyl esterase/lipase
LEGDNVPPTSGPADSFVFPPPPFYTADIDTINAAVEDATKSMGWMRDNAALYTIDSNHIAIGGISAGAITALLQAYDSPPADVAPQAVLSFLGAMYGTEGTISAGAPPAFVVASSNDMVVPFDAPLGTQAMVDQMNSVGVYNEFYVQTIGHTVDLFAEFDGQSLLEHNMEFLAQVLVIPEPTTLTLITLGLLAMCCRRRKRA